MSSLTFHNHHIPPRCHGDREKKHLSSPTLHQGILFHPPFVPLMEWKRGKILSAVDWGWISLAFVPQWQGWSKGPERKKPLFSKFPLLHPIYRRQKGLTWNRSKDLYNTKMTEKSRRQLDNKTQNLKTNWIRFFLLLSARRIIELFLEHELRKFWQ